MNPVLTPEFMLLTTSIFTQAGAKRDSDVMEVKVGENLKEKQVVT